MRRTTTTILLAFGAALVLATGAAASYANGGVTPQTSGSPNAAGITTTYYVIAGFTGFIFLLVEGLLIAFIIRFRRRGRARDADAPQIHGATRLEIMWTVFPVLILAVIAGVIFYELPGIKNVPPASAAGGRVEITVEGHQFYWLFRYPNGAVSVDTMWAPVGETVYLRVVSPDVNHSWWIPKLGGKIDAIPGRVNHTWFKATNTGVYQGQCAELCGIGHALMTAQVQVVPRAEYARRTGQLLSQLQSGSATLGKQEFQGVCEKCHRLSGPRFVGPTLGGNPLLADRASIADIVLHGRRTMPAVGDGWNDKQIDALVAYSKTLVGGTGGG